MVRNVRKDNLSANTDPFLLPLTKLAEEVQVCIMFFTFELLKEKLDTIEELRYFFVV